MIIPSRPTNDTAAATLEQPHRRDLLLTSKGSALLLLGALCLVAFASSLHSSVYLHRSLAGASAAAEERALSLGATANGVRSAGKTGMVQGKRGLRRNPRGQQRSREIDSGSFLINVKAKPAKRQLDFVIAGFPKTGTTSLLYAFGDHPETDIARNERCAVTNPMTSDYMAYRRLQEALSELSSSPHVKRAIKCPNAVYHAYNAIVRMEHHAPDAKFVIGLRHPILMLESYYNYRVTELHDKYPRTDRKTEQMETIPPLDRLVGLDKEWKGVSTDSTDFKTYLMQFGKTKVEARDLEDMVNSGSSLAEKKNHNLVIKPNTFSIFLYTVDQLEDTGDVDRSNAFRSGLQHFLGLQQPLKPVGRENLNHFVGKKAYPETVDICLPKYNSLRRMLLIQGGSSAEWIEKEFLESPDVVVANQEHFLESIRSWSMDPCGDRIKQKKNSSAITVRKAKLHAMKADRKNEASNLRHLALKQENRRVFVGRKHKLEVLRVKL